MGDYLQTHTVTVPSIREHTHWMHRDPGQAQPTSLKMKTQMGVVMMPAQPVCVCVCGCCGAPGRVSSVICGRLLFSSKWKVSTRRCLGPFSRAWFRSPTCLLNVGLMWASSVSDLFHFTDPSFSLQMFPQKNQQIFTFKKLKPENILNPLTLNWYETEKSRKSLSFASFLFN